MISIITATYNSEDTIKDTIESVLTQTYKNIEYIIIDGASTDNTITIIDSYQKRFKGKLKLVSEPDKGIYDAMNKGLALAQGDIVGILNSDDYYAHENVLDTIYKSFETNNKIDFIFGNLKIVKRKNVNKVVRKYISKNFRPWLLKFGIMPPHPTVYIKRNIIDLIGLYNTDYKIVADYEYLIRLMLINKTRFKHINDYLLIMRDGGISNSGIKSKNEISNEIKQACINNGIKTNGFLINLRYLYKLTQLIH